ncbi:hypothetical protein [Psychroserpens mesophilus]|uniref:hypothetical protein n=1 Tax=Psychroserpens mesophilus TaxID=325473 RepID=UPI00058F58E9|nr:hypothetical protein [Psychroserpens mesophilus]
MNYKDVFVVNKIHYNKSQEDVDLNYQLNNYDYLEPKLVDDFYLKYFVYKILFELDILEIDDFLSFHFEEAQNKKLFTQIIKHKLLQKIDYLVNNAKAYMPEGGSNDEIKLEDGFIETKGKILKPLFEDYLISHKVAWQELKENIIYRKSIIEDFMKGVNQLQTQKEVGEKLVWSGKPSHLAYFISQLIEEGYIEPPRKRNDDINYQKLSNRILNSFDFANDIPSNETLKKYGNVDAEKYITLNERFVNHGFHLPNLKIME